MGKLMATGGLLSSLLAGAIVWFVLYVIIGVTLWVSFVAGGGVAIAGVLLTGPLALSHRGATHGQETRDHSRGAPIGAR